MRSIHTAHILIALFALHVPLHAGLTYVDATDGPTGNTTLVNGSTLLADDSTGSTTWRQRDNVTYGSAGTIFEGLDPAPQIQTSLSGLTPGQSYRVYVHFVEKTASTAEKWNIRAGFTTGNLTLFANTSDTLSGATAAVIASTLAYDTPPTIFTGIGTLMAGLVGITTADAHGRIAVFVDDYPSTNTGLRTWYDGISYEAVPNTFTYVDATSENTVRWDGQPFSPAAQGNTSIDNHWETRLLGNHGNVYEAGADGAEDAPMLVTTLSGLTPNTAYVLHGYFWDASSGNWRFKASANAAHIHDNGTPSNPSDDFLPSTPLSHFAADDNAAGTATQAALASSVNFVTNPLFTESDRRLLRAVLGTATSDTNGEIKVYIDDLAGVNQDQRTWYDGLGYRVATPLAPTADEDGDGLTNGDEQTRSTSPYFADSDGDGFNDGAEVTAGSDPLAPQSVPPLPGNSLQITADGAWTWFNDERALFHQGSLFIGYVKGNGQYGVTRYDPASNESFDMIVSTSTSQQMDDHNNPSITVLPDGKLMVLYAKHRANANFYQRTSLVPLPSSLSDWGPEIVRPLTTAYGSYDNTYNNTYVLSGEANRIYNFHRYINFNPTITVSNDLGASWQPSVPFIEVGSGNVRPYPRYCSNGVDRIDLIYTDGHPRDIANSVYHMYYRDGGFHKTDGTLIDTFANLPLDHQGGQKGAIIYQYSNAAWGPGQGPDDWIPEARGWTWDIRYSADGHPACVFQVQIGDAGNVLSDSQEWPNSRIYYYYARWTGTAWQKRFIAKAGRAIYSGEADYGGGMCIDPTNTNVIYISTNAANPFDLTLAPGNLTNVPLNLAARFEIYRGETTDGGLTFTWQPVTANSAQDNLRPIIPSGSPFDETLVWFNGTYASYTNYDARVLAILRNKLRLKSFHIDNGHKSGSLTWSSSPGWSYRITGSPDLTSFAYEARANIPSHGQETSVEFAFPAPLQNAPNGFFRVETQ